MPLWMVLENLEIFDTSHIFDSVFEQVRPGGLGSGSKESGIRKKVTADCADL
jgi:hypothetical protein